MDASTSHAKMNDALRQRLGVSEEQLAEFCQRWKIAELAVFGSVLRDDFRVAQSRARAG
jgi:predicted nucleotidyltransferase